MKSEIKKLQEDISLDINTSIVLQRTLVIATKLEQIELIEWIKKEINGYFDNLKEEVPKYRYVPGRPRYNSIYGWEELPMRYESVEDELQKNRMAIRQNVKELEEYIAHSKPYSPIKIKAPQVLTNQFNLPAEFNFEIYFEFNVNELKNVLIKIRNVILEWLIKLENILGEEYSFSETDIEKVKNITVNFYGTVEKSQINLDSSNNKLINE